MAVTPSIRDMERPELFKRTRRIDPERVLIDMYNTALGVTSGGRLLDDDALATVPHDQLEELSAVLTSAIADLSQFRRRVDQARGVAEMKPCAVCGKMMSGRADRRFCSGTCRQAAHRRKRVAGDLPGDEQDTFAANVQPEVVDPVEVEPVEAAPAPAPAPAPAKTERPERQKPKSSRVGGGNRRKHDGQLEALVTMLSGAAAAFEHIEDAEDFDASVTAEEAARLRAELSEQLRGLNRLNELLGAASSFERPDANRDERGCQP